MARADRVTALVIDALVDHLREVHSESPERVCPHALPEAFERSPRPMVLDVARGILACADRAIPAGRRDPRRARPPASGAPDRWGQT